MLYIWTQLKKLLIKGSQILNIWIFNIKQQNLDWQKNSMIKVKKEFFFIFMFSYAEIGFWGP
jgi:hypothetical protein